LTDIKGYREKIDELDRKIVELLNARAEMAVEIGNIKSQEGKEVYDAKREVEVMKNLKKTNRLIPDESLRSIYREIISASRSLEKRDVVAFLGPEGTFSHEAAITVFGSSCEFLPVSDFETIFSEVEKGNAMFGVIPVENSIEGIVPRTLDLLAESNLLISAEISIKANQNLVSKEKSISSVKKLFSHPQPLGQCRKFILKNLQGVEIKETSSTSAAAKLASKTKNSAALASLTASQIYGLNVLKRNVQDHSNSMTRFLVVSRLPAGKPAEGVRTRTSIAFKLKNKPGELYRVLGIFEKNNINLTKIASRPVPSDTWGYVFYLDFEGHRDEKITASALDELAQIADDLKIFGSYPMEQ